MKRAGIICAAFLVLTVLWYVAWHSLLAGDVARVKNSILYHDTTFKGANPHMELRADAVKPAGFPFHFRVRVTRPTLSMILGKQTFAVSLPSVDFVPEDSAQGRYKVLAPASFDAVFAMPEEAPEQYAITLSEVPQILLRAQGSSLACPNMPGLKSCDPASPDAPLVSFAADMPEKLILTVTLNGASKQIGFNFTSMGMPVFMAIPKDASGPLEIFVGMLREAMIYKGK